MFATSTFGPEFVRAAVQARHPSTRARHPRPDSSLEILRRVRAATTHGRHHDDPRW